MFHPANGTASASVLLFFDKERYLFNAGEGLQRLMREYKQRMAKVRSWQAAAADTCPAAAAAAVPRPVPTLACRISS